MQYAHKNVAYVGSFHFWILVVYQMTTTCKQHTGLSVTWGYWRNTDIYKALKKDKDVISYYAAKNPKKSIATLNHLSMVALNFHPNAHTMCECVGAWFCIFHDAENIQKGIAVDATFAFKGYLGKFSTLLISIYGEEDARPALAWMGTK
jgi:hypothetical protein